MKLTKSIREEWYEKLRAEGFDDLERGNPDGPLTGHGRPDGPMRGPGASNKRWHEVAEGTAAYYDAARDLLRRRKHWDPYERRVWEMHAEGATMREIAAAVGLKSPHKINDIVHRLQRQLTVRPQTKVGPSDLTRNRRTLAGGKWATRAIERMEPEALSLLIPLLYSVLKRRISKRSSAKPSR